MVSVRRACQADGPQVVLLYQAEGWQSFTLDKVTALLTTSTTLLAEADDKVVGLVRYLTDGVLTTFVAELVVAVDYRGRGIGQLLVAELQSRTTGTRLELISVADDFYEKIGCRAIGQGYRLTKKGD